MEPPPGEDADEVLVRRCQTGDFAAFEVLYKRYQRPILSYIYQITRSYEDSACIAQDVFMRVYEHVDRFDTQRRFSTWFYTIARNASIDWLQARNRRVMVSFSDLDGDDERDSIAARAPGLQTSGIEQNLSKIESGRLLREALEELPQMYREIIELVVFQEKTYDDASVILGGVSLGTLRSRMFHALRRLRTHLEKASGKQGEDIIG